MWNYDTGSNFSRRRVLPSFFFKIYIYISLHTYYMYTHTHTTHMLFFLSYRLHESSSSILLINFMLPGKKAQTAGSAEMNCQSSRCLTTDKEKEASCGLVLCGESTSPAKGKGLALSRTCKNQEDFSQSVSL